MFLQWKENFFRKKIIETKIESGKEYEFVCITKIINKQVAIKNKEGVNITEMEGLIINKNIN